MTPVPHNRPTLGVEEEEAALRALRSGWVAQGREVERFEEELCAFLGLPAGHAVALSSGSAALFVALNVLGASGAEVFIPGYCCTALRNAVLLAGGTPRYLDNRDGSANIDPASLPAGGFAIVPHSYGIPVSLPSDSGCRVVEDCAQALGALSGGEPVGSRGRLGVFSFYATKLITSGGQGGMLVSRDRDLVEAARDYREFDCRQDDKPRFNLQMTDLQGAVGRAQLERLPSFLARREEIFGRYLDAGLPLLDAAAGEPVTPVRFRAVLKTDRPEEIIAALGREGIRAIVPLERDELLAPPDTLPHAEKLTRSTVSLPLYPTLSDDEVARVISVVTAL